MADDLMEVVIDPTDGGGEDASGEAEAVVEDAPAPGAEAAGEAADALAPAPAPPPPRQPGPAAQTFQERLRLEAQARAGRQAAAPPPPAADLAAERERLQRLVHEDPVGFIRETGRSWDEIERQVIEGKQPHVARLERQVAEIAQREREREAAYAQWQAAQERREAEADLRDAWAEDPELELVARFDAWGAVLDEVEAHYRQTGEVQDTMAAAKQVEAKLTAQVEKALGAKKIAAKLGSQGNAGQHQQPAAAGKPPAGKTLTNQHAAQVAARTTDDRASRIRQAAAGLKWLDEPTQK